MKIKEILDEITNESSTNQKMVILSKYKENETLKKVLYLALSKRITFGIKKIPEYVYDISFNEPLEIDFVLSELYHITHRDVTGHDAIRFLSSLLARLNSDDAYVIERIISKDLKIGMGTSNINKVFNKLIEITPYMGAQPSSEKLAKKIIEDGDAISQLKKDGRYANAIIQNNGTVLESRAGEITYLDGAAFLEEMSEFEDCVLNGELTIDGYSNRSVANGIVSSMVSIGKKISDGDDTTKELEKFEKEHNISYKDMLSKVRYTIWDIITIQEYFETLKSITPYKERFKKVVDILNSKNFKNISLIEHKIVSSYEEAITHFQEMLARGEEGTILKSLNGGWVNKKPNWQVKMKLEIEIDLKIVGFNYGTGKNSNLISSIKCESSCGKLFTQPTGITEKMMKFITENQDKLVGAIVECKCCGVSQDSIGNYSVLHPVFKKIRDDKNECDSLESILKIENMTKKLL